MLLEAIERHLLQGIAAVIRGAVAAGVEVEKIEAKIGAELGALREEAGEAITGSNDAEVG